MKRALILDLDFTLLHLEFVPDSIEVPGRTRSAWVAPRTVEILRDLQSIFDIVLATARSYDGTKWVVDGLKSRKVSIAALILEDGARLGAPHHLCAFEPSFNREKWRANLQKEGNGGPPFEWQFDFENCLVARTENGAASEALRDKWAGVGGEDGATLRFFCDGRKVYALAARANKWSALQRLLGDRAASAAGIGDGENDLVWLPRVASPATFARAKPALVEAVKSKNGFVSDGDGHAGIAEILERWL